MDFPDISNLKKEDNALKKAGFSRKFRQFWLSSKYYILPIILAITSIFTQFRNDLRIEKLENTIKINNTLTTQVNNNIGGEIRKDNVNIEKTLGEYVEFKPEDWIDDNYEVDAEGYYCPTARHFEYWSIWSKKKIPLNIDNIKIKLTVKLRPKAKVAPIIAITYGEYHKNFAPTEYYRLNFFEDGRTSLRLYNSIHKSVRQDWLVEEPDLASELEISLSPRSLGPDSRSININPKINYSVVGSSVVEKFKPKDDFIVALPKVNLEDGSVNEQLGIGTKYGACFKISSVVF